MDFMNLCEPVVRSPSTGRFRKGRGFSRDELAQAGLSVTDARRIGLMVDLRRMTSYAENVESIKSYIEGLQEEIDALSRTDSLTEADLDQSAIAELTSISAVKADDAQLLVRAGIRSLSELAYCDITKISKKTGIEEARLKEMAKAALKKI